MNSEIKKLIIIALFLGRHNLPGLSVVSALLTRQRLSETHSPAAAMLLARTVFDKRCRVLVSGNTPETRQVGAPLVPLEKSPNSR